MRRFSQQITVIGKSASCADVRSQLIDWLLALRHWPISSIGDRLKLRALENERALTEREPITRWLRIWRDVKAAPPEILAFSNRTTFRSFKAFQFLLAQAFSTINRILGSPFLFQDFSYFSKLSAKIFLQSDFLFEQDLDLFFAVEHYRFSQRFSFQYTQYCKCIATILLPNVYWFLYTHRKPQVKVFILLVLYFKNER